MDIEKLCDDQGLVDIDQVRFEITAPGRGRWVISYGDRLLYLTDFGLDELPELLDATKTIFRAMAGLPPADVSSN